PSLPTRRSSDLLMNQVQVIKGYLSMKKYNQVDNKLNEMIDEFEQERKLMGLNASSFVLWLIRFNSLHRNIRVTYNIHTKESVKEFDKELLYQCQQFINAIETVTLESELYHVTIDLDKNLKNIELIISIRGYFKDIYEMEAKLNMLGKQLDSRDRKSTRLNSSHVSISYAVFCLKTKKTHTT